jgi:hypothetical protein
MTSIIIAKKEKIKLLKLCIPILTKALENIAKGKFGNKSSHYMDALISIRRIGEINEFTYKNVFFVVFALVPMYLELKNKVLSGELSFSHIKDPAYWSTGSIDINTSIFFCCTFLQELYKDEISLDFKKIELMIDPNEYIEFRKYIVEKSKSISL